MKNVYVLYETDEYISRDSMSILGIYTTEANLIKAATKYIKNHWKNFRYDETWNKTDTATDTLREFANNRFQTQCGHNTNLHTEIWETNVFTDL